jgi:hypothetical protein
MAIILQELKPLKDKCKVRPLTLLSLIDITLTLVSQLKFSWTLKIIIQTLCRGSNRLKWKLKLKGKLKHIKKDLELISLLNKITFRNKMSFIILMKCTSNQLGRVKCSIQFLNQVKAQVRRKDILKNLNLFH